MSNMLKKRLGRGLDSLFSQPAEGESREYQSIPLSSLVPNPFQPRRVFDAEELAQLRQSIAEKGLLQPIVVRAVASGFQIVAGERRLRACKELGLDSIPAIVREVPDSQMLEIALVENIQRRDLNPIEKAEAFRQLIDSLNLTHEEAAIRVGKDRSSVTNYLRLLDLPTPVRDLLSENRLSMGHARAILSLPSAEEQTRAAQDVVDGKLSVRDTEKQFVQSKTGKRKGRGRKSDRAADHRLTDLERQFEEALATKVRIVRKGSGGQILVDFYSDAEFVRLQECLLRSSGRSG